MDASRASLRDWHRVEVATRITERGPCRV